MLRRWHDHLLYMAAYPDDARLLRLVHARLRDVAAAVRSLRAAGRAAFHRLDDSGIAGTITRTTFTLPMCRSLLDAFGTSLDIDWHDDSAGEALDDFLPHLACAVERDGLLDTRYTTKHWFQLALGAKRAHPLAWIVDRFERIPAPDAVRDQVFDSLELPIQWRLQARAASRTFNRFPARPVFFQARPLVRAVDTRAAVLAKLPPARPLPVARARQLLRVCRAALSVRRRETDPLTYASERDVALLRMDRGIDVALFGMVPSRRLPIESYFGFVAARNRVPVAYGGGWVFGLRSEIGVNIFDEFRGGESAVIFSQIMRAYHHYLGPRRFYVDPYQFGEGNPEAIRSGAFWFYWRLGFRPTQPAARKLATEEAARIAATRTPPLAKGGQGGNEHARGYRTPPNVLRRLAKSPILFDLDRPGADTPHADDVDLRALGLAVSRWIGKKFKGDRTAAQKWSTARAWRLLKPAGFSRRPPAERQAFENLSVLIGPIEDVPSWTRKDRRVLAETLFAKGAPSERPYALHIQNHRALRHALLALTDSGKFD